MYKRHHFEHIIMFFLALLVIQKDLLCKQCNINYKNYVKICKFSFRKKNNASLLLSVLHYNYASAHVCYYGVQSA